MHGLSDSSRTWSKLVPVLAADRHVYAVDLPGHGRSARPDASYDILWYINIVSDWIRSLGLEEFDLVGHSLGGGISMGLMAELPGQVRRLALIAAAGLGLEVALPLRIAAVTGMLNLAAPLLMGVGTHAGILVLGGNFDAADRAYLAQVNARPGTARALSRTLGGSVDLKGQREHLMDHVHRMGKLPPIAVYWGDRDPLFPVRQAEEMDRYLQGVTVRRFANAGHYPHREATTELVPELLRFLDQPQSAPFVRDGALPPRAQRSAVRSLQRLVDRARSVEATRSVGDLLRVGLIER